MNFNGGPAGLPLFVCCTAGRCGHRPLQKINFTMQGRILSARCHSERCRGRRPRRPARHAKRANRKKYFAENFLRKRRDKAYKEQADFIRIAINKLSSRRRHPERAKRPKDLKVSAMLTIIYIGDSLGVLSKSLIWRTACGSYNIIVP